MVTQLYTAPIRTYTPVFTGVQKKQPAAKDVASQEDAPNHQPDLLEASKEQNETGVISIDAIIKDFNTTLNAIGGQDQVRQEVEPYLKVVLHQATKPQPSEALIKQNLRGAADTLDQFITDSLGEKSRVVREWVDTLFSQPIHFQSKNPLPAGEGSKAFFLSRPESSSSVGPASVPDAMDAAAIQQAFSEARAVTQRQDKAKAVEIYQDLLSKTTQPQLKARALFHLGQLSESDQQLEEAQSYYQSAQQALGSTSSPKLQSQLHKALGKLSYKQGNTPDAMAHLKQAVTFDEASQNIKGQVQSLNQLGKLYMQHGQSSEAQATLQAALEKAQSVQAPITPDILNNLGHLARKSNQKKQAFHYYRQSLSLTQSQPEKAQQALQHLAALYLDIGKPQKALKALQKAVL